MRQFPTGLILSPDDPVNFGRFAGLNWDDETTVIASTFEFEQTCTQELAGTLAHHARRKGKRDAHVSSDTAAGHAAALARWCRDAASFAPGRLNDVPEGRGEP